MKLSPLSPTFLQERDALIAAAQAGGSAADVADIWAAFATRGMGFSATNPSGNTVVQAFDLPNITQSAAITINDSTGNNNGFPDPGELITINIPFDNNTGQTANNVSFQLVGGGFVKLAAFPNAIASDRTAPVHRPCRHPVRLSFHLPSMSIAVLDDESFNRSIVVGMPESETSRQNFDTVTAPYIPAGWTSTPVLGGVNWATVNTSSDTAPNSIYASTLQTMPAKLTLRRLRSRSRRPPLPFRSVIDTTRNRVGRRRS